MFNAIKFWFNDAQLCMYINIYIYKKAKKLKCFICSGETEMRYTFDVLYTLDAHCVYVQWAQID
jgi:hypothetical protein